MRKWEEITGIEGVPWERTNIILGTAGFLVLLLMTFLRGHPVFWDEAWYLKNVALLDAYGISGEFMTKYYGPAGPLYALVHYLLFPLTSGEAPGVRLVNVGFLAGVLIFLYRILKGWGEGPPLAISVSLLGVPMVFVCSGMALTEMPSMFFAILGIWFFLKGFSTPGSQGRVLSILGGISLALSILGRQPYLVTILAIAPFVLLRSYSHKKLKKSLFFMIPALLPPLGAFMVWGDIQPPRMAHTGEGLRLYHGFLGLGYTAIVTLLIAPRWFVLPRSVKGWGWAVGGILVLVLLNGWVFRTEFLPMKTVMENLFPASYLTPFSRIFAALAVGLGGWFGISGLIRLWEHRTDKVFLMAWLATFLILATTIKVTHQFSSRYVAQAAPFLVLMLAPYQKEGPWKTFGMLVGMGVGLVSLGSFF